MSNEEGSVQDPVLGILSGETWLDAMRGEQLQGAAPVIAPVLGAKIRRLLSDCGRDNENDGSVARVTATHLLAEKALDILLKRGIRVILPAGSHSRLIRSRPERN